MLVKVLGKNIKKNPQDFVEFVFDQQSVSIVPEGKQLALVRSGTIERSVVAKLSSLYPRRFFKYKNQALYDTIIDGEFVPLCLIGEAGITSFVKECSICHETKKIDNFGSNNAVMCRPECKACTRTKRKRKDKRPDTPELGTPCEVCEKTNEELVEDHNHATEEHRGWLCDNCNRNGGRFNDSPLKLWKHTKYLLERDLADNRVAAIAEILADVVKFYSKKEK